MPNKPIAQPHQRTPVSILRLKLDSGGLRKKRFSTFGFVGAERRGLHHEPAPARTIQAPTTNQKAYWLTIGMSVKTLTIARIAIAKEVINPNLICASEVCYIALLKLLVGERLEGVE